MEYLLQSFFKVSNEKSLVLVMHVFSNNREKHKPMTSLSKTLKRRKKRNTKLTQIQIAKLFVLHVNAKRLKIKFLGTPVICSKHQMLIVFSWVIFSKHLTLRTLKC